jgi:hypothetical protein
VLTGPWIVPAWKPELASPKDIADAIAAEWFCDEVLTAAEFAILQLQLLEVKVTLQSD